MPENLRWRYFIHAVTVGEALINLCSLFDEISPHHEMQIHSKFSAINSTAHSTHSTRAAAESPTLLPHAGGKCPGGTDSSSAHRPTCPGSKALSYQHPLHCHQKGSSVSCRAFQVTLLGNTLAEDQTGTFIDIRI